VIARRIKVILSKSISSEQFGFLEGRQIHEAIGVVREGMHNLKTQNLQGAIIKIDLPKAYDRVNWLYIHLMMTYLGFEVPFINWVTSCLSTIYFVVLINGVASPFFHVERGLQQGFPLSPLLFLLVAGGLSISLRESKRSSRLKGIQISPNLCITHLLFLDDILLFYNGLMCDVETLVNILGIFKHATSMLLNA
jgi:hypothetical protein